MSVGSFISTRLSLRPDGRKRLSPSIVVAVGGIALSFVVMMLSIAIVTGFKSEITRKIMGFDAQIKIMTFDSYRGDPDAKTVYGEDVAAVISQVLDDEGVHRPVVLTFSQAGLLKTDSEFLGVGFRAFDRNYDWEFEKGNLVAGELPGDENQRGVTISRLMADKLGIGLGDKVDVYFFSDGHIRPRKFEITGIYCSNFGEYDNLVAYAPWDAIAKIGGYADDEGEYMQISGLDYERIEPLAARLQEALSRALARGELDSGYVVTTAYSSGAVYFNWLDMLDTNIVVILILMGCVSGFMLVACVLILILERVRMVGILKSIGASNRLIKGVFVRLGTRVVGAGLIIGNTIGWSMVAVQSTFHLIPLDPESYYLTYVPMEMPVAYWLMLNAGVSLLAFALMLVPVGVVGRLQVVKVLRFE